MRTIDDADDKVDTLGFQASGEQFAHGDFRHGMTPFWEGEVVFVSGGVKREYVKPKFCAKFRGDQSSPRTLLIEVE
ncbi:MAG: hypothetical protein R2844_04875 [Caldilineales bacterium]